VSEKRKPFLIVGHLGMNQEKAGALVSVLDDDGVRVLLNVLQADVVKSMETLKLPSTSVDATNVLRGRVELAEEILDALAVLPARYTAALANEAKPTDQGDA
jgi:hypothetical protein